MSVGMETGPLIGVQKGPFLRDASFPEAAQLSMWRSCLGPAGLRPSGSVLEAPILVGSLEDVTVVGEAIEERGGRLRVAEHARPFAEGQVRGDHDGYPLIEAADQMEEELAAGLGEGLVTELVEDQEIKAAEEVGQPDGPLIHHSDRGGQYTSDDFRDTLARYGIDCSVSGSANCYDNAVAELFRGARTGACEPCSLPDPR